MAYASWSVVFGEQPSASKWNILGTNDASFNDGTGIAAGSIKPGHITANYAEVNIGNTGQAIASASYTDVTSLTVSLTPATSQKCFIAATINGTWAGSPSVSSGINIMIDGAQDSEIRQDMAVSGMSASMAINAVATLSAAAHTIKVQYKSSTGTLTVRGGTLIAFPLGI